MGGLGTRLEHTVASSLGSPDMGGGGAGTKATAYSSPGSLDTGGLGTRLQHTVALSLGTGGPGNKARAYSSLVPRLPGYGGGGGRGPGTKATAYSNLVPRLPGYWGALGTRLEHTAASATKVYRNSKFGPNYRVL